MEIERAALACEHFNSMCVDPLKYSKRSNAFVASLVVPKVRQSTTIVMVDSLELSSNFRGTIILKRYLQ